MEKHCFFPPRAGKRQHGGTRTWRNWNHPSFKKPLENPWLHLGYPWISRHLVDEADGGSLAAVKEFHVDNLQLLQADVEGLQLLVLPIQGDDLEEAVVEAQPDHPALGINDPDDPSL